MVSTFVKGSVYNIGLYNSRAYRAEYFRLILLYHVVFRPYIKLDAT